MGDTKFALWFGSNDAEMHPVMHGWMRKRKEITKAVWVVIDPRMTPTGAGADLWLPITPGTDMALAYGMIHEIISKGLHDKEFVAKWVEGFDELVRFVNAKGYSPEWAAGITGIPAETIRKVARLYATTKPATLFTNSGISHHVNAVDTFRVLAILVAITGNLGVPGGGCMFLHNSPIGLALPGVATPEPGDKEWRDKHAFKQIGPPPQPDYLPRVILEGKIKAVMGYQGNPLIVNSDTARVRRAYEQVFFVDLTMFPEEKTYYADYVLPICSHYEQDYVFRRVDRGFTWRDKVTDPLGESKPDMLIIAELCEYMGMFDDKLSRRYWTENFPRWWAEDKRRLWNEVHPKAAGAYTGGVTQERMHRLMEAGKPGDPFQKHQPCLRAPCPPADHAATKALAPDQLAPDGGHPGTSVWFPDHPSWKLLYGGNRFPKNKERWGVDKVMVFHPKYDEKLKEFGHAALPEFYTSPETVGGLPTLEYLPEMVKMYNVSNSPAGNQVHKVRTGVAPDARIRAEYPIQLVTGRPNAVLFQTITYWAWGLVELGGDPYVQIHPKLAAKHGIKNGDPVEIETPRGAIQRVAQLWDGIVENAIYVPFNNGRAQKVYEDLGRRPVETVNVLTAHYYDNLSGQQEYRCQLCRIRKI